MEMLDDGHEDLFGGIWPFMKRALFLFLPIWVALIVWYAGKGHIEYNILLFMTTISAGLSIPLIQVFEKIKLKGLSGTESDEDNVIK